MKKIVKIVIVSFTVALSLTIGVFIANIIIFKDIGVPIIQQIETIKDTEDVQLAVIEETFDVSEDIKLGEIAVETKNNLVIKPNDSRKIDNLLVLNIARKRVGELVDTNKFIRSDKNMSGIDESKYTLEDYVMSNKKVQPYDIFYHILHENKSDAISLLCCNNTENNIETKEAVVVAIGVDSLKGYYGYNYITVGTSREYVESTFKGRLQNISILSNCGTYIDDNDNFIFVIYNEDKVISFMTGNTLGEKVIEDAIIK